MAHLEVRNLTVEYPRPRKTPVRAVAGVDLDVERGQIVGLVGESGCGKSTLARAVVGLEDRASGNVMLGGAEVLPITRRARPVADRKLQMIFQNPYASLNPRRKIWRQVSDGIIGRSDSQIRTRVDELLESVGLPAPSGDRFPHEFSGGQRQRIAIARALASDPDVIVADEAVSALDASTQAQVANLLVGLARDLDLGLLFISHDLSVVRRIADQVAVMYLGRIVEIGVTNHVWSRPLHPYTEALIGAIPTLGQNAALPTGLPGEVPDPAQPPTGCRFHPRCPHALARCSTDDPVSLPIVDGRHAACWLQTEGGPRTDLTTLDTAESARRIAQDV